MSMSVSKKLLGLLPLIFSFSLVNGCVTKALWTNGNLEAWNGPADSANLRLFEGGKRRDLLVVYDEYSERTGATHSRAYWLDKNEKRLEESRMPHFVSTNAAFRLSAVPIFDSRPEGVGSTPSFYAILIANQQSFALYSGASQISSHILPEYNDGRGKMEKAALTPFAVTADVTIVGGFLGYLYLAALCNATP